MVTPPVVLAIAGTDPSGGAGLAADLATFSALGVHGAMVVAAVTAQDTLGVHAVHQVPLEVVDAQLRAVLDDLDPVVVKTGMLGSPEVVQLVAERCADRILVVDPVLRASTGATLADEAVIAAYRDHLLPVATVVTPNAAEDEALGRPRHHTTIVTGSGGVDTAYEHDGEGFTLDGPVIDTDNDHGTGCTYASALAAHLALGVDLVEAASRARRFVTDQLTTSSTWTLGRGRGPVAHIQPRTTKEMSA